MPMVAEKEYQYGAEAFEALQSCKKVTILDEKFQKSDKGITEKRKSR